MGKSERDSNRVPTLIGVSTSDGLTPITLEVDPSTHELLVKATISSGSVSTASKYSTNAIDDYTTTSVTYICKEGASTADWWFTKIDETGNFPVFTHATVLNNATVLTYADAYAIRATTLVYGTYSEAF